MQEEEGSTQPSELVPEMEDLDLNKKKKRKKKKRIEDIEAENEGVDNDVKDDGECDHPVVYIRGLQ